MRKQKKKTDKEKLQKISNEQKQAQKTPRVKQSSCK